MVHPWPRGGSGGEGWKGAGPSLLSRQKVDDHPWKTAFEGLALPWYSQNPIYSSKKKTVYVPYGNITKLSNLIINYVTKKCQKKHMDD